MRESRCLSRHVLRQPVLSGSVRIVPNGIDVDRFRDVEPFTWARRRHPAHPLSWVRYNEPRKGFKYLLRAMPLVHQQFPDARLVVAGGGKRDKFEGSMERYGVRNVDFVGLVSAEELPRYYASCDLFCAPSISEKASASCCWKRWPRAEPLSPGHSGVSQRHDERKGRVTGESEESSCSGAGDRPAAGGRAVATSDGCRGTRDG